MMGNVSSGDARPKPQARRSARAEGWSAGHGVPGEWSKESESRAGAEGPRGKEPSIGGPDGPTRTVGATQWWTLFVTSHSV